jgi:hypothetical protein
MSPEPSAPPGTRLRSGLHKLLRPLSNVTIVPTISIPADTGSYQLFGVTYDGVSYPVLSSNPPVGANFASISIPSVGGVSSNAAALILAAMMNADTVANTAGSGYAIIDQNQDPAGGVATAVAVEQQGFASAQTSLTVAFGTAWDTWSMIAGAVEAPGGGGADAIGVSVTLGTLTSVATASVTPLPTPQVGMPRGFLFKPGAGPTWNLRGRAASPAPLAGFTGNDTLGLLTSSATAAAKGQAVANVTLGALTSSATASAVNKVAVLATLGAATAAAVVADPEAAMAGITLGTLTLTATVRDQALRSLSVH